MLAEASEQGLLDIGTARTRKAGRPEKRISTTALGLEYLDAYHALGQKALKSRRADLRAAVADAAFAARLAAGAASPYALFLELNELAGPDRGPPV